MHASHNILLIGGCGFLGRNLARRFLIAGYRVFIIDYNNSNCADLVRDGVNYHRILISDSDELQDFIKAKQIQIVFHLVSSLLPSSEKDAYHEEIIRNIQPTFRLIDFLAREGIKLFFFSSGGTIYGKTDVAKVSEDQPLMPINYYGVSKLQIEEYIRFQARVNALGYVIVRPSNPYGPGQRIDGNQGFIAVALGRLISNTPLNIWGDGSIIRDYIYIDDLCEYCLLLLRNDVVNRAINVGTGVGYSQKTIIDEIEAITSKKIVVNYMNKRSFDAEKIVLDVALLHNQTGKKDTLSIREGITNYLEYLQQIRS